MKHALEDLRKYILTDSDNPTFKSQYHGNDFHSAVETFIGMIEEDLELGANYLMNEPDAGCSWLQTDVCGESRYWNIDDIWDYWVQINKDKLLEI